MVQQGIQRFQAEDLQLNSDERGIGIAAGSTGICDEADRFMAAHSNLRRRACWRSRDIVHGPFAAPFINSINKSTR
jgi:hypothetical protein